MEDKEKGSSSWIEASERGLALGMLSVCCLALKQLATGIESALVQNGAGIILWVIEFFGCILLLRRAMLLHVGEPADPEAGYDLLERYDMYRFGRRVCTCSSFIMAAATTFLVVYVPGNIFSTAFQESLEMMGGSLALPDGMVLEDRPGLVFISQFLYCWIYGSILSAILSRPFKVIKITPEQ